MSEIKATLKKAKAIFFDGDETCYGFAETFGQVYVNYLLKYGIQADPRTLEQGIREYFLDYIKDKITDEDLICHDWKDFDFWYQMVRQVVRPLFSSNEDFQDFFERVYRYYERAESRVLFKDWLEFVQKLKSKNYLIGLYSNFDRRVHRMLHELQIEQYFDYRYCAADLGYVKPARGGFNEILVRTGLKPSEIIFIGDNPVDDYQGSRLAGFYPILLDRHGKYSESSEFRRIVDYHELIKLL